MKRIVTLAAVIMLALQSAGCGLLIYPERQGQKGGRIDPGIAILDAAGLLVFIVPGLIAFGVDFITGTIYLPGTDESASANGAVRQIRVAGGELDSGRIERIVEARTGRTVDLDGPATRIVPVDSRSRLIAELDRSM